MKTNATNPNNIREEKRMEIKCTPQELKELIKNASELTEAQLQQINQYLGKIY